MSNLLELTHQTQMDIIDKLTYDYDKNGNRKHMNRMNGISMVSNSASNITYNQANQMLTFNDKNITYDANGNMETVTNSCGTTTYIWNARNQLAGINGFNANCSSLNASFKYDALGRRIEKTINGKTTNFLYDGFDIAQEIEGGTVSANYIRTLNIDEPLARIKTDGTIRYYQQDALGSVIALTDETGVIKTQYVYDPFGNVDITGESSDNPFQFAGRENDGTGHLFERNRYNLLGVNRYISADPIGFAGGDVNLYVRVTNNPLRYTDPYGLINSENSGQGISSGNLWIPVALEVGAGALIGAGMILEAPAVIAGAAIGGAAVAAYEGYQAYKSGKESIEKYNNNLQKAICNKQ